MGSTVSTGKHVTALKTADGRIAYFLFENTYEKNCYPHTPSWSCVGLGYAPEAVTRLVRLASSCEGGMLQTPNGNITPEGYLQGWFKAMAAPAVHNNHSITLGFGASMYATLPASKKEFVVQQLQRLGRQDVIDALEVGPFEISLKDEFEVINALYGPGGIAPWKIIGGMSPNFRVDAPELAFVPTAVKVPAHNFPAMYRAGREDVLIADADGGFYVKGWAYSVVGRFIEQYAAMELQFPGSYKSAFRAYRAAVNEAPQVPLTTEIHVTLKGVEDSYACREISRFIGNMGATGESMTVTFEQVMMAKLENSEYNFVYHLLNMTNARWVISESSRPKATAEDCSQPELFAEV